jgi:2-amino-4-hydroxy-6-hydroxymethyldihydropteridine diphosphokinase
VGDKLLHLQRAVDLLGAEIPLQQPSAVYETAPMYLEDQPPFFNAAVLGTTNLGPISLLRLLKRIESEVGRQSRVLNGPREVDLDLIAYGDVVYTYTEDGKVVLRIPHPKLAERRFVLAPLADVAGEIEIAGAGQVSRLLEQTNDQAEGVLRIKDAVLHL